MPGRDLVVVGGSAGSLGPLITVMNGLPPRFSACVLVVVHGSADSPGNLARILERESQLPVSVAANGLPLERGVFVSPPDHHLLVTADTMLVTRGPKENGFRPAIDPLFRTAALAHGPRVVGVVLSGALDDGANGLHEIKTKGGLTVVQDPDDAEVPSMPRNAIMQADVDYILPAADIAPLLCQEAQVLPIGGAGMGERNIEDPQLPGGKTDIARMSSELGPPSGLTCPDCGGALWQIQEGQLARFQCHVGHRYSSESLVLHQDGRVEAALWTAVRALEERAELRRRMASQTGAAGLAAVSDAFAEQADTAAEQADQIRGLLTHSEVGAIEPEIEVAPLTARRKRSRQQ